jgi:cytochrome oxidase Cu insertion factor (SCO1/SenC/PrrC family)
MTMLKVVSFIFFSILLAFCINITFVWQSIIITFLVSGFVGILLYVFYWKLGEQRRVLLCCLVIPIVVWGGVIVFLNPFLLLELVLPIVLACVAGYATTFQVIAISQRTKKWIIAFSFSLLFLAIAFYGVPIYSTYLYAKDVHEKEPLLLKGLRDLNGKPVSLESFRGKVVLLDLWGIHCAACRYQTQAVDCIRVELTDTTRFVVFAVNVGKDTPEDIRQFLNTHHSQVPVLYDDGTLMQRFQFETIPNTILLDTRGCVSWYKIGFSPDDRLTYSKFMIHKMKQLAEMGYTKNPITFALK